MNRSLVIGLAITIAITLGLAVFFYTSFIKVKSRSALEAIPDHAAVILELNNLPQAWASLNQTDFWKDIRQNEAVKGLNHLLMITDSAIEMNSDVKGFLSDNHTAISFHSNRGERLSILLVSETGSFANVESIANWIAGLARGSVTKRIFDKEAVYEINDGQRLPLLTLAFKDKLLLLSQDGSLVEEGIQKLKYKHLQQNIFEQAKQLDLEGTEIGLYLQYEHLPLLLALANKPEYKDLQNDVKVFANWSVLNVSLDKERFNINGTTYTHDSLFQFLDLFKEQVPLENNLSHLLPLNTALSLQFNISDYGKFSNDLTEYLQNTGKLDAYTSYVDSLEDKYQIAITEKLVPQIGPAALIALHESVGDDFENQVFGILQFKNTKAVQRIFESYEKAIARKGENDSTNRVYKNYDIHRLQLGNVFKRFFGHSFEHLQDPFYSVKDNVFIFANDFNTLTFILDELEANKTLSSSESYRKHAGKNITSSNVNLFLSPGKSISFASVFANDEFLSALNRYAFDVKKFEFVEIQYANASNSTFFTNINIHFNPGFKEETKMLWATKLDTAFDMQPAIVFNSTLKQNCILVQDVNNTLYYLNNAGTVLWKSKLSGKIISEIYQMDPSRTGEIAYLFSTDKQACMITPTGNNLYGFPVRFPGTATAGISVFDFYKDSTFQFFVPLESKKIMGYTLNGKPVPGWNPRSIETTVSNQLSSFRLSSSPYICGAGANNKLLIWSYAGKQVLPAFLTDVSSRYPAFAFQSDTTQADIWLTDTAGNIKKYLLSNQLELTLQKTIPSSPEDLSHRIIQTSGGYSILAAHPSGFSVFDDRGSKPVSKIYTDSVQTLPFYTYTKDKSPMIGYAEKVSSALYLIDLQGNTYPTLPIAGSTPFITGDVVLNNSNFLICGDKSNSILLYRLK